VGQLPVYYNQLPGWHGGRYCDLPESPLYSFGYGLSYTEYRFSDLEVLTDDTGIFVSVNVTNVGSRDGVEVVQLYFNDPVSSIITPVKQLIEFERVPLKAKETKTVSFNLDYSSLSLVRADETRVVEPGEFHIMVGGDSREQSLLTTVISIYNI
jgi:beta-glucosidase